jgi:hypothetical protein
MSVAQSEKKKYTNTRKRKYIEVDGVDYLIEAMSGTKTEEYRETIFNRFESDPNNPGKQRMKSQKGTYKDLFVRCMYVLLPGNERRPCDGSEADTWTDEICSQVFEDCQEVCGLKDGDAEAKKD